MNNETKVCPICRHPNCTQVPADYDYSAKITCLNCGKFTFDLNVLPHLSEDHFSKIAPALALERKLAGNDGYTLRWDSKKECVCVGEIPFLLNYPMTFPEKMNRVLANIARMVGYEVVKAVLIPKVDSLVAIAAQIDGHILWSDLNHYANLFFADVGDDTAIERTLKVLETEGLIETAFSPRKEREFYLTLKGVQCALDLRQNSAGSDKAFLAMWFSETLDPYVKVATEAARLAGYILERVATVHHNGQIMDKVLNMINDARFVISDLTCEPEKKADGVAVRDGVRGGVYFEAGYAKGQNKQVILTCKDDPEARERIHFDLQQVNTIFWQEQENGKVSSDKQSLIDVLRERIIFTVGKGPLYNMDVSL